MLGMDGFFFAFEQSFELIETVFPQLTAFAEPIFDAQDGVARNAALAGASALLRDD